MNAIVGFILSIIALVLPIALFAFVYRRATFPELRKALFGGKRWLVFVGVAAIIIAMVAYANSQNRFVYFWDYGGRWDDARTQSECLFSHPLQAIRNVVYTTWYGDYNTILPTVLALPVKIFGNSFSTYVMTNTILFMLPAWLIILTLFAKVRMRRGDAINTKFVLFLGFFATVFAVPLVALMEGYIDVAALIPCGLAMLLALDYQPLRGNKRQNKVNYLIGLMLAIALLFRRYFSFLAIGIGAMLVAISIVELWRERDSAIFRDYLKNAIWNLVKTALFAFVVLVVVAAPMLYRMLATNYSEAYVGYDAPLLDKLGRMVRYMGLITIVLAALGAVIGIKRCSDRKITIAMIVSLLATVVTFYRVQDMSSHHYYLVTIQFFMLAFLALEWLAVKNRMILSCIAIVLVFQPIRTIFLPVAEATASISVIYSSKRQNMYRSDMDELWNLANYINEQNPDRNKWVYILSSSAKFNSSTMSALAKPDPSPVYNLLGTNDVDMRDGFPLHFFDSKLVVMAEPIQTHLSEGSQQVIVHLGELLLDKNSCVGRHFERLDREFMIGDKHDVSVHVYSRISDYEKDDIEEIEKYYNELYPKAVKLFKDRLEQYTETLAK